MVPRITLCGFLVMLSFCTPGGAQYENCTAAIDFIADGWCDLFNNIDDCSYDGGDCCSCSCIDGLEYECGSNGFYCADESCLDPVVVAQFPSCTGNLFRFADGDCNVENNSPECGYDGGDCCMCTCANRSSCIFDFDCIDPNAGDELYDCQRPPATVPPCSSDVKQTWIVEDKTHAHALAEAINCSGGSFQVKWIGNISMDETIYVVGGTDLQISGSDTNAVLSGNLEKRLITVVNASLQLRNVSFEFGSARVGGAIVASDSNLTLHETSFVGNQADGVGGALYVVDGSIVSMYGDTVTFSHNSAVGAGGAIYIDRRSFFSWEGRKMAFIDNLSIVDGGALTIKAGSTASWTGEVLFSKNVCGRHGGAVYATGSSGVSMNGSINLSNNTAGGWGGALMIVGSSNLSMAGSMIFVQNIAGQFAGGLYLGYSSTLSWHGETRFIANKAGISGGAMLVIFYSNAICDGHTTYDQNIAGEAGGALHVGYNSSISWARETFFSSNTAENQFGGALVVERSSQVFWNAKATFINNSAKDEGYGGAIAMVEESVASWKSEAVFRENTAASGGALYILTKCTAYFNGSTIFDGNVATSDRGGALYLIHSNIYWRNKTTFIDNTAVSFGGAVAFKADGWSSDHVSYLVLAGSTVFDNNTSDANGGALAIVGGLLLTLETADIIFSANRAKIAGGTIYMWGNDRGPEFIGVSFVSNSAQYGGGVYSTGCGNALVGLDGDQRGNPVVFIGCNFVDNQAIATGGAIHSAAGQDLVINTTFSGNSASEGGALNLAGTSRIVNCSFVENISDGGRGPAIANIGYLGGISNCSFHSNVFSCDRGEFLGYNSSNNLYAVLCKGCEEPCKGCFFERASMSPVCSKTMENTHSPGDLTTLEMVVIDRGYWRATISGQEVLPCYNTDACLGGLTGANGFCLKGYEGPYCAICSDGYSASLGFTCNRCSNNIGSIVVTIVLALALLASVILAVSYLLSRKLENENNRSCVEHLMRHIPVQSAKIVIVAWQIVIQFVSAANVQYPHDYQRFLDGVKLLDFDLGWILSASCVLNINFHDRLLFATVWPLVVIMVLGVTYKIAARRNNRFQPAIQNVRKKHLSAVLLLTFFVYSNVSSILFQSFACEHLEDGNYYLRADYRIKCDSGKHYTLQVYAAIMMIVYTLGIPAFYATLLIRNHDILSKDEASRDDCPRVLSTSSLWRPYKPSLFYFEVVECARRALLVGVVVFFNTNTVSQIAVTLILAFTFVVITEMLDPYTSTWDTWLSRTGHVVVFFSVYVALLLKVDVSSERRDSRRTFEIILLFFNGCMIAAVVIEALVMMCSFGSLLGKRRDVGIIPDTHPIRSKIWPVNRTVFPGQG